jgi:type II secretory pathway predicted ATPase ExeA
MKNNINLATEKDGDITSKAEKSERALIRVMRRCQKPIGLFGDDGHDRHAQTLRGLKQMIEKTGRRGIRLTIVFVGHPRLKNDPRRPSHEETGARATVFDFEDIQGHPVVGGRHPTGRSSVLRPPPSHRIEVLTYCY